MSEDNVLKFPKPEEPATSNEAPAKPEVSAPDTTKSDDAPKTEPIKENLKDAIEELAKIADDADRILAVREVAEKYKPLVNLGEFRSLVQTKRKEQIAAITTKEQESVAVEAWPEPVDLGALLNDVDAKIRRYSVIYNNDISLTALLWTAATWVQQIVVAAPILVVTAPKSNCGKSRFVGALRYLVWNGCAVGKLTVATIYRIVDKGVTLIAEEGDHILSDKDIADMYKLGWNRGAPIPRLVPGEKEPRYFNVFGFKAIAMNKSKKTGKLNMDEPTQERSIIVSLDKKTGEKIEQFRYQDDEEFVVLRRKFARWAKDNMVKLAAADPVMPKGLDGRVEDNWRVMLAIADLAGGTFPEQARAALLRLSPKEESNPALRLGEVVHAMFVESKGADLASEDVAKKLNADKTAEWCEYGGRGQPITQRQIAALLKPYDIHPKVVHPTGRANYSPSGYELSQFLDFFRRYLPHLPPIIVEVAKRKKARR